MKKLLIILLANLSLVLNAQTITADASDRDVKSGAFANWVGQKDIRVGSSGIALVIPFELPELSSGSGVTEASFGAYLSSVANSPTGNVVLSGLSYRSANTVLVADYDAASTEITSTYATPTTSAGTLTENNQNLIDYINAQYDSGAVAGNFIFFRIKSTEVEVGSNYWVFNSVNNGSNKPQLTLTFGTSDNPSFNTSLSNQIINEGTTLNIDISATDPNGDDLTFTAKNLPSFAILSQNVNGTASIEVKPQVGDTGNYNDITITVTDGTYQDEQTFSITVKDPNINARPVIDPIANQIVEENQTKKIAISVSDVDGNDIAISVNNKPSFATLNQISNGVAELVLNPSNSDIGDYIDVEVTANDGKVTVSEKFNIKVTEEQVVVGDSYYCDPVNGSMSNDGSQAHPWGSLQATIGAKKKFKVGDVIFLMSGAHGQPYLSGNNNGNGSSEGYITIKAASGQDPIIASIQMGDGSYYAFDGVTFSSDGSGGSFSRNYMLVTSKTFTHLKVTNCTFHSGEDSSGWSKADWYSNSEDAVMIKGDYLVFNNNSIINTYFAFQMEANYAEVKDNVIDNFGADAIRCLGSEALYEGNLIRDAYVEEYSRNHDDAIQMYDRSNVAGGVNKNIIIRNNKIYNFADPITKAMIDDNLVGYSMQGIIQTDGHSDNVIIENNLVVSDHYHGITLAGAVNCRVQNNTVMKTPTSVNPTTGAHPWISFSKDKQGNFSHDCVIRNNISTFTTTGNFWMFDENKDSGFGRNNLRENNIIVDEADYSSLFIDYTGFDFNLIGSGAIDKGVNTDLTATDIAGNTRMVGLQVDCGAFEVQADSDDNAPELIKATDTYFDNEVVIVFSESVTKSTAELVRNYTLDNGTNVVSAVLGVDAVTVTLTTTTMSGNILYTVTANNVEDFAGNKAINTTATFTYLCGAISASSYQNDPTYGVNPPEGAFDGDMSTKWAANGDGEWILKNYCSTQLFKNVSIAFGVGDKRIYYFSIEISSDGINYTEVYDGQSSGKSLDLETFAITETNGKYLRIIGKGNNARTDDDSRNLWNNYVEVSIEKEGVDAPEFTTGNIADQNLIEGDVAVVLNISATATTDLNYSITPNDLSFVVLNDLDNGSATITISTQTGDAGEYKNIQLTITDENGISSSQYFDITILAVGAPEFTTGNIADQNLTEGDASIVLNVSATSSTSLSYSFSHSNLSFIEFEDLGNGSATITLSPQTGDAGDYNNIQLTVTDENGVSTSKSFDIKVTAYNPLENNELFGNSVSVYPNPVTNNTFTIDFSDELEGKTNIISVYNLSGVVIYNREVTNSNKLEIVLPEATASGLYLLNLSNNEFTIQKKIIIK